MRYSVKPHPSLGGALTFKKDHPQGNVCGLSDYRRIAQEHCRKHMKVPPSTSHRAMHSAAMVILIIFMLPNMATPVYPWWQAHIGFLSGEMTAIFAAYILGLVVSLFFSGQLSDRFGHKAIVVPGIVLALVSCITYLLANSVMMLVIARILTGFSVGTIVTAGIAMTVSLVGIKHVNKAALFSSMAIVMGAGVGPLLSGYLTQTLHHPVTAVYLFQIVLVLIALFLVLRLPVKKPVIRISSRKLRVPGIPSENRIHLLSAIGVYAPALTAASFVAALTPAMIAHQVGTQSPLLAGLAIAISYISSAFFQFSVRRLDVSYLLIGGAVLCIVALFLMAFSVSSGSSLVLLVACVVAGGSLAMAQFGGIALLAREVASSRRAEANSLFSLGGFIPAGLFSGASGFLIDAVGMSVAMLILACVVSLLAVIAVVFIVGNDRRQSS